MPERSAEGRRPDLEKRIEALEQQANDVEDRRRLASGVEGLRKETAGLNVLLNRVDEQQRHLTMLDKRVEGVDEKSADRVEVERIQKKERRERRRLVWITSSLVALIAFALTFGLSEAAHDSCEKRQEANRAIIATLEEFKTGMPQQDFKLQRGIDRINATLTESCDSQYLLHLPS